jgi:hypothetical protein
VYARLYLMISPLLSVSQDAHSASGLGLRINRRLLALVQVIIGAGSVWFGGAAFGGGHRAKLVWKYHRLSGYLLLPFLLTTVHLGGAWSTWVSEHSAFVIRLVVYMLAPLGILTSVYSRIRCVGPSMISRNPFIFHPGHPR